MLGDVPGKVNDILNNGAKASAPDNSFHGCFTLTDGFLPKHAQNIVGNQRQLKYQLIGIEFSRQKNEALLVW